MKFDDKPLTNQAEKPRVTPQSAMDAYFEDMFGSAEDPLKKLTSEHELNTKESVHEEVSPSANELLIDPPKTVTINHVDEKTELSNTIIPKPKLKLKKQESQFKSPFFEEPDLNSGNISSLIIPAAFPKLAPVATQAEPVQKTINVSKQETNITVPVVKPKLDVKMALAILEKQKSKLSVAQKQRLKEKLKLLTKAKSKISSQVLSKSDIAVTKVTAAPIVTVAPAKPKIVHNTEIKVEEKSPIQTSTQVVNKKITTMAVKSSETEKAIIPDLTIQKNSRPEWANRRFECLIFSVAGLKLAVPLISLGAIYKIEKEFIPLVGRADWFMGLYHHLERNVRVIDTAQWVMPERCSAEVRAAYKFIIRLGGNDWGMACDAVHQSIQLYPDQVKWRTERTKRAWLFGTVIDHMCALIDADSLSTMLNQQSTKNPRIFSQ